MVKPRFIIRCLAIWLYVLAVIVVFGRALFPPEGQLIFGDDIHRQYYFYREFFNSFLKEGIFPWWNPYNFGGTPFIANPVVNIWYPPNWLFVFFPLNIAYSWHLALHILWAMVGMYFLISNIKYQILNIHIKNQKEKNSSSQLDMSAFVGGLVFGLSGFFMARVWAGHVDVIAAASWMPWVFGAFWRLLNGAPTKSRHGEILSRGTVLAAVMFAVQIYAGYQTVAFLTLEALVIVILLNCYIVKNLRPVLKAFLVILLGLGLAGLQLLPEQEFFRNSIRTFEKPYSWSAYGSLTFASLKQLVNPFYFGDQTTYSGPPPNYPEHAMYVGRVGLALALLAFIKFLTSLKYLKVIILGFTAIALLGLWLSLGPNAPIDLQKIFWELFPTYKYLRIPPRHLLLFVFGASVLAGFGLTLVRQRLLQIILTVVILIELIPFAKHFIALKEIPEMRHDPELTALLSSPPGCGTTFTPGVCEPYRLLQNFGVWVPPRDALDFDSAASYRIFSATGYDPSILRNYYEFIDAVNGNKEPSILRHDVQVPYFNTYPKAIDFLNLKYILVPRANDPLWEVKTARFKLIREDVSRDFRLYENTTVLPRFFLVSRAQVVGGKSEVLATIQKGEVDYQNAVLLDQLQFTKLTHVLKFSESGKFEREGMGKARCGEGERGEVSILSYTPNVTLLQTKASCDMWLVSSEVFYPGWAAYVDGGKAPIFEGNMAFRTIFIPKGEHTVRFEYMPNIFFLGGLVSLLTGMITIVWMRLPQT